MNRTTEPVAVVVALTDPSPNLKASLARFADEAGTLGEVVLVDSSGRDLPGLDPRVRVIRRPPGRLAPELWRDGLLATDAPLVAFSTAQTMPCRGWLASLVERLRSDRLAGVGGPIEPGSDLSATDRAVALLRYSGYFPPLPDPSRVDPPGDNALYRRDRLMEVESSWADGFWEVEVHRALRERGEILAMAGEAVVTFERGVRLSSMIFRRWAHARRYGAGRSKDRGPMARAARVAACPLVPPLLLARSLAAIRARGMAWGPWLPALPGLTLLASAWAMGEVVGTLRGLNGTGFGDRREPCDGPLSPALPRRGEGRRSRCSEPSPLPISAALAPSPPAGEGRGEGARRRPHSGGSILPGAVEEIQSQEHGNPLTGRAG